MRQVKVSSRPSGPSTLGKAKGGDAADQEQPYVDEAEDLHDA